MNLFDAIFASLPTNTFRLNSGGTAFVDALNKGVTVNGTQALTNSIVTGNSKSLLAKNANVLNFATPVYNSKSTYSSFTLEAWYQPRYFASGGISILSHNSENDGLYADIDNINFTVKFTTSTVTLSWPIPDASETYHVVGTYTPGKMQLYINGEVVKETDTSAYLVEGIKTFASNNLWIGQSVTSGQAAVVDGLAVYTKALNDSEIYRHFLAGRNVLSTSDIAGRFGGNSFDGSKRDIFSVKTWDSRSDWAAGDYTDVEFEEDYLQPAEDPANQTSRAGVWTGVYEVSQAPTLYGVQVDWDGDGLFTVQASINEGSSWLTLTNGRPITGTFNFNPNDKSILIKVTFTGGVVSDISEVRRLRVIGYTSQYVYGTENSRKLTLNASVATNPDMNEPIEGNIDSGMETFGAAGTILMTPDAEVDAPRNIATIETWVKFNGTATSKYVFDSRPGGGTAYLWASGSTVFGFVGGTLYVNGVNTTANTFTVVPDTWYHIVFVFTTPLNTQVDVPNVGDRNIATLNLYPTALSAADAAMLYLLYGDYPTASLATNANPVTEGGSAYTLYAYDWSISPAG